MPDVKFTPNRALLASTSSPQAIQINVREQLAHEPTLENVHGLWYDWFCNTSGLFGRGKRLWSAAKSIVDSPKFKADEVYVFFKNNCPAAVHPLYDDFRICSIKTGDVLYTISRNAWGFNGWQVYDIVNKGGDATVFEGSWKEVKAWFLTKS